MSEFFVFSPLALLHLSAPSYYGQKAKVLRGAEAYGFNDTSDCTGNTLTGKGYCEPAKMYRHDSPRVLQTYMSFCQRRAMDSYLEVCPTRLAYVGLFSVAALFSKISSRR
jgi:hypothetical protein